MRKIVLLLLLIVSISLVAQELNELSIVGKADKTNDIVPASIKDANNRKAACIVFLTDLEVDMDFRPNIELVKLISKAGRHEVYVQPGERVIEVFASGFKPLNVVLSSYGISKLQSGDVYKLEITGEKINNLIPVNFIIEPGGAEIFVDGTSKGIVTNIQISAGKHTFKIVKEHYQTIEKEENVSMNNNLFNYELIELMDVAVTITTNPTGATVSLDDTKATITPKPFFYPEGEYTIRIEKENYETIEESIIISSPQTNKNYTLEDIRASLTIKTHPNATVYINDESYKGDVSNLKLAPQIVKVRVEMPKAETITKSIVLQKKDNITKELFPEIEKGKVIVNTIPVDAVITLTGDAGEKYTSKKPTTFKDVPIGKYELLVTAKGYKSYKESFSVKVDETVRKQILLEEATDHYEKKAKITQPKKSQVISKGNFFDLYTHFSVSNQDYAYNNDKALINDINPLDIQYHYKNTLNNYKINCFFYYQNKMIAFGYEDFDDTYTYNSQIISVNTDSKYLLNNLFYITLDANVYYLKEKGEWKEFNFKFESERNYGTFNSGFCIEDEKDIHLLTPKHKFRKGFFAYTNYSSYLWNNIEGKSTDNNSKCLNIGLQYAFLNYSSYFMIKPYIFFYNDFEAELYSATLGINSLLDISQFAQLSFNINNVLDEYSKSYSIDFSLNFFPKSIIDIYLNYNLSTYDSNWDGKLNEKDKMASSFGGGLGLIYGYN
ncbi:MAG: PEGA domain-containing protein [Candidatus Cloacimonetes bacterium]|nr:PEGA domain-containing protein [Candidatus Cloacimonadota bacterium]